MRRIRVVKWLTAVLIMLSAMAGMIVILVPNQSWYRYLYEQQNLESKTGITVFEAEFNYEYMVDEIMGNQIVSGMASFTSSEHLQNRLEQLGYMYQVSKWSCGIGIALVVGLLLLLRNQKWYECFQYGSILTVAATGVLAAVTVCLKPLHAFIFKSEYTELFGNDRQLTELLPDNWAFCTWMTGIGILLVLSLIFLLIYAGCKKSYSPHRF